MKLLCEYDEDELRTLLAALQSAYDSLITGTAVQQTVIDRDDSVTYATADLGRLQARINEVKAALMERFSVGCRNKSPLHQIIMRRE